MPEVEFLFEQNPVASIKFLRPLLISGNITSLLLTALDAYCIAPSIGLDSGKLLQCGPAGMWVLTQGMLRIAQFPIRLLLMSKLTAATHAVSEEDAVAHLLELNRSSAWRTNKRLGAVNLLVFAAGIAVHLWVGGGPCELHWLLMFHLGLFVLRCFATVVWFVHNFAGVAEAAGGGLHAVSRIIHRSTATTIVSTLPRRRYGTGHADGGVRFEQGSCVVCLEEFALGEELPEMPCGHCIHQPCLQDWLSHRRACPICQARCAPPSFDAARSTAARRRHPDPN